MGQQDTECLFNQTFGCQDLAHHDLDLERGDFRVVVVRVLDLEHFAQVRQGGVAAGSVGGLDSVQVHSLGFKGLEAQGVGLCDLLGDLGVVLEGDQGAEEEEVILVGGGGGGLGAMAGGGGIGDDLSVIA